MEMRNYHGTTCPINVLDREGTSSVRQIRDGMRTLLLIFRSLLLFRPMRFSFLQDYSFSQLASSMAYGKHFQTE